MAQDLASWLQMMMLQNQPKIPQMDILGSLGNPQSGFSPSSPFGKPAAPAPSLGGPPMSTGSIPGIQTPGGGYGPAAASGAGAADPTTAAKLSQLIFSKSPSPQALAMAGK